jgi:hypothetical protein
MKKLNDYPLWVQVICIPLIYVVMVLKVVILIPLLVISYCNNIINRGFNTKNNKLLQSSSDVTNMFDPVFRVKHALELSRYNRRKAAKLLGVSERTVYRLILKHNIYNEYNQGISS